MSWSTFLEAHWSAMAAVDFFALEVVIMRGLVCYLVFIVIQLGTRPVEVAGIVHQPFGEWMVQIARNLTDVDAGFLYTASCAVHDHGSVHTAEFRSVLESGRVTPSRLPPEIRNLNAYAERFIRSIREECLDRVIPLGEGRLRHLVGEYLSPYYMERNHQGHGNRLIESPTEVVSLEQPVPRREPVGSLLSDYYCEAS